MAIKSWDQLSELERLRKSWSEPYECIRRAYQLLSSDDSDDRRTRKLLERAYFVGEPVPAPREIPQAP